MDLPLDLAEETLQLLEQHIQKQPVSIYQGFRGSRYPADHKQMFLASTGAEDHHLIHH
jgi:hypothetical protein